MGINISRSSLASRIARSNIGGGLFGGIRTINGTTELTEGTATIGSRISGFLSSIVGDKLANFGVRVGGWLLGSVGDLLSWSFTEAWSWITSNGIRLWTFDWNKTDKELQDLGKNDALTLAAIWGSAFGNALGWTAGLALGYGLSLALPVIGSKALATVVSKAVLEEGLEEVNSALQGAVRGTVDVLVQSSIRTSFVGWRRLIQYGQVGFTKIVFGADAGSEFQEDIANGLSWGGDKAPEWSFSSAFEKGVSRLKPISRTFVEAAADEFGDALFEAGFVIANTLDSQVALKEREKLENPERGLVLYPNRDNEDEKIILTGKQDDIETTAQLALQSHRQLESKDVGEIAAVALQDFVTPQTSRRTLTIFFNEFQKPPYTRNQKRGKKVEMKVSEAKPGISLNEMSRFIRPFDWGGKRGTMKLDNGRQFAVYGISETECDRMFNALLRFTTAEPERTVYTDVNSGVKPWQRKEPIRVYPVKAVMNYREPTPVPGQILKKSQTIQLWEGAPNALETFR